jgi:hypothetical protein
LSISFFQNSETELQGLGIGLRTELKTAPKTKNLTILNQTQHDECDVMDIKQIIMT